jgi:hypothetical protein
MKERSDAEKLDRVREELRDVLEDMREVADDEKLRATGALGAALQAYVRESRRG